MEALLQETYKHIVNNIPRLLIALFLFLVLWIVAVFLKRAIIQLGRELEAQRKRIVHLAASTCKIAIIVVGLISAIGTMGINISALVAGIGLTGFALGFALKDALSNLLSGILLLIYQPFRYGDHISVAGCEGEVIEINLRYTVIKNGNQKYLVPNSVLFSNNIRISENPNL